MPLTFDGVKVTPWGMGGIIGQRQLSRRSGPDDDRQSPLPGMLPLGVSDATIARFLLTKRSRQHRGTAGIRRQDVTYV